MAKRGVGLISEIERDLLDGKPLADLLRKCVVLGGQAGSDALTKWATQELKGYGNSELPDYRRVAGRILIDAFVGGGKVTGQRIAPQDLPSFTHDHITEIVGLPVGIRELQSLLQNAEGGSVKLSLPMGAELVSVMNADNDEPFQRITAAYWSVATSAIEGTLDHVTTVLAELIAELRKTAPDVDGTPTAEQATNAVNVVVHKSARAKVTVTANQAASGGSNEVGAPPESAGFWTTARKIGAAIVGVATIAGTYFTYVSIH